MEGPETGVPYVLRHTNPKHVKEESTLDCKEWETHLLEHPTNGGSYSATILTTVPKPGTFTYSVPLCTVYRTVGLIVGTERTTRETNLSTLWYQNGS